MAAQELANIAIKLSANMVDFENDMGRASRLAKKRSGEMKKAFKVSFAAITAAAVSAGGALAAMVKVSANVADNIQKMSIRLGVSTKFLSEYRHVAELSGTSMEKIGDGVRKMSKSINDANNGLSTAKRAFESLGISLDQINSLSPEKQFELIADKISKVESQSVKAGASMDIFGRSGSELLTVLNAGGDAIKAMRMEAENFGLTITQEAANAAADFNDELTRLANRTKGWAEQLSGSLYPALTEIMQQFNSGAVDKANDDWQGLRTTIATVYGSVLLIKEGFELLGTAIGVFTAQMVQAFTVLDDLANAFGKRLKLGALTIGESIINDLQEKAAKLGATDLLPDFVADSNISESASELHDEIRRIETAAFDLAKSFTIDNKDTVLQDSADRLKEIFDRISAVKHSTASLSKVVDDGLNDSFAKVNKTLKLTEKQMSKLVKDAFKKSLKILTDFNKVVKSLETPLEKLNREFADQIKIIGKYMLANSESSDAQELARITTEKATEEYIKNKKALEDLSDEVEKVDFAGMFDSFASGLNPAISALQGLKDELTQISEMDLSNGEKSFYSTGVAAEFALSSMASMAQEGSDAQKKLQAAAAITNTILGISAILEQGKGDPYTAFARMAAMAAMVASMGVQIAGAFGGGGGAASAEQRQQSQGTGTVLGDSSAKSESIINALDLISDAANKIVGINSKMLRSLNAMNSAISGTANQIAQTGEIGDLGTVAGNSGGLLGGVLGGLFSSIGNFLFGSSEITDRGISVLSGGISDAINGDIFRAYEDATRSGLFGSSRTSNTADLEEGISNQIGLIFASMRDAVMAGAEALGVNLDEVRNALDAYRIEEQRISLLDLNADEQRAALEAVFSSIFDGLVSVSLPFITQFQQAGEGLGETLARVSTTVLVFEEAIQSMGLDFIAKELNPELFAQAAVAISDFAGGMESFIDGYTNYVNNFLSESEQLEILAERITGVFSNIDLKLPDTRAGFTELIQSLDLTTAAGQEAFGVLISLSGQMDSYYNNLEDSQQEAANAQQDLADMMDNIASQMEDMDLSTFEKTLKDIRKAFNDQIAAARKLGATEKELAMIQAFATRQIQNAIDALEGEISGAINDLYGGNALELIEEQITALEEQQSLGQQIADANRQRYEAELAAIKNLRDFVDSLFLNETLSTLNPLDRLNEAQAQFDELFAAAQGGDAEAINALPAIVNTLLGLGRDVFASGSPYTELFDTITRQLESLGLDTGSSSVGPPVSVADPRLLELLEQQRVLQEEIANGERFESVMALAEQIAALTSVTEESLAQLAERLGLPIEQFISDLGINLDDLTADTATALAEVAQLLGVELSELAESVGISLGDLANSESLLNDALQNTIDNLPEGIQGLLEPLLEAIETSTNPKLREELLAEFIEIADNLPESQRDLLAPFFDQIDPISEAQQQISQMDTLNSTSRVMADDINGLRLETLTGDDATRAVLISLLTETKEQNEQIRNMLAELAS